MELLPPFCEHDNHLTLIKELCQLAVLMLQRPRTSGKFNVNAVIGFIRTLLVRHGNVVGRYSPEMEHIIKNIMWKLIEAEREYLGRVWIDPIKGSEQGNGQSAYETETVPIQKSPQKKSNMESLSGVLSVLTQGLVSCPLLIMSLPARTPNGVTIDHDDSTDLLVRRVASTASVSLEEHHDTDMVQSAIGFLLALVRFRQDCLFCSCFRRFCHYVVLTRSTI